MDKEELKPAGTYSLPVLNHGTIVFYVRDTIEIDKEIDRLQDLLAANNFDFNFRTIEINYVIRGSGSK